MPAFGIASAGAILVGQAIGARLKEHVPSIVWLTCRTTAAWQGLVGLAYLAMPEVLFEPFSPAGEAGDALRTVALLALVLAIRFRGRAWKEFRLTERVSE